MRFDRAAAAAFAGAVILVMTVGPVFGHGWMAPPQAAARKSPLPSNAATLEQGRVVYASRCAECHGTAGRGDGPKASLTWPSPTNLTTAASHPVGDIAWKIETGRGDMPAFKDRLTASEIWAVAHWVRALKK